MKLEHETATTRPPSPPGAAGAAGEVSKTAGRRQWGPAAGPGPASVCACGCGASTAPWSTGGAPTCRTSFGLGPEGQVRCKLSHSALILGICRMHAGPSSAASLRHTGHGAKCELEAAREPAEGLQSSRHHPTGWRATRRPEVRPS
jgi:hypothetical protein